MNNDPQQEKEEHPKKENKCKQKTIIVSTILALFLCALVISHFHENIPILNRITKAFNFEQRYGIEDKGIKLAIKSNFIQKVGISDEYDGLVFTVDNVIMDGRRIVIFYTIENKSNHKYIDNLYYDVHDENGDDFPSCKQYPNYSDINLSKVKKIHDNFDLILSSEFEIPSSIQVEVKIKESQYSSEEYHDVKETNNEETNTIEKSKELPHTWKISVPINKELFKNNKKYCNINKTVDFEGQKIYIDKITIYPITTILDIKYDKSNTMKIFSIEDLKLVDNSEEWTNGLGSVISSYLDDFTKCFYFESNYFKKDNDLYASGNGIRCIEKDKIDVVVDIDNKKLLKSPDNKLKLDRIEDNDNAYILVFEYPDDNSSNNISFNFGFKDALGNYLSIDSFSHSSIDGYEQIYYYIPKDLNYQSPITLTISDYPNMIDKPFKIKVK